MALTMWYRGVRFVKDFVIQYLNYIYLAGAKGHIVFTDGTKEIKFSSTPIAEKTSSWDVRKLPAVLIGKVGGGLQYITFSKDKLKADTVLDDDGSTVVSYMSVGGNFDLNLELSVRAATKEERDNLVDITGIYLAHPDAKDYFLRHYLVLPEAPKLSGENEIHETGIDHPIYATNMSLRVISRWQEYASTTNYRLLDVVAEIEAELEVIDIPGRTILDGT